MFANVLPFPTDRATANTASYMALSELKVLMGNRVTVAPVRHMPAKTHISGIQGVIAAADRAVLRGSANAGRR